MLTGPLPKMWLVTVSIDAIPPMSIEMSPAVALAIPEANARVRALVATALAAHPAA